MLFRLMPLAPWGKYNRVDSFVVRAASAAHARQLAAEQAEFEGADAWLDEARTRCEPIEPNGPPEVICRDSSGA